MAYYNKGTDSMIYTKKEWRAIKKNWYRDFFRLLVLIGVLFGLVFVYEIVTHRQ